MRINENKYITGTHTNWLAIVIILQNSTSRYGITQQFYYMHIYYTY